MDLIFKSRTDKIPKPNVKVDYPWHEIESRLVNQGLDAKKHYPYHIFKGVEDSELNTIRNVMIGVTNNMYEAIPGVVIELRSKDYLYYAITDDHGIAHYPYIANTTYMVTLAKKGVNMESFHDIRFDRSTQVYFKYGLVEQNIRDGWFANTGSVFYVDMLDGGYATVDKDIFVCDDEGNPVPNAVIQLTRKLYKFIGVSGEDGIATLNAVDGFRYETIMARSGVNQKDLENWLFADDSDIIYIQEEKNIWDGMYATTDSRLYVDTWNGGEALQV